MLRSLRRENFNESVRGAAGALAKDGTLRRETSKASDAPALVRRLSTAKGMVASSRPDGSSVARRLSTTSRRLVSSCGPSAKATKVLPVAGTMPQTQGPPSPSRTSKPPELAPEPGRARPPPTAPLTRQYSSFAGGEAPRSLNGSLQPVPMQPKLTPPAVQRQGSIQMHHGVPLQRQVSFQPQGVPLMRQGSLPVHPALQSLPAPPMMLPPSPGGAGRPLPPIPAALSSRMLTPPFG